VAITLLQVGEQKGAFLSGAGAGAAHDSPAALAVELARGRACVAPGREILEGEGFGVPKMSVERRQQRRPALDDPNPGVGVAVDAALVTLGKAEGAFEVEVVERKVEVIAPRKQSRPEGLHRAGHVLRDLLTEADSGSNSVVLCPKGDANGGMRSRRFPMGFKMVTFLAVMSVTVPWILMIPWLGTGWALLAACGVHVAALVLILRFSGKIPGLRRTPSYTFDETLMPYAGHCPGFEDRQHFPLWTHAVEENYPLIRAEFEEAIVRLAEGVGERVMLFEPTTGAWVPRRPDGWLVDRNANLMTRDEAWQHLQVEQHCPRTWELLKAIPGFRGECSFSKLAPHARIKTHSGECDVYYRCHLGIRVPGPMPGAGFEVGAERRSWEEGKLLIFCDGYRHSAWNDYDEERVVLLFNVIRPEFEPYEASFRACYNLLLYLKTGITSRREKIYWRPVFAWLSALGVIYANMFGARSLSSELPEIVGGGAPGAPP
jgi:hypothetical protein